MAVLENLENPLLDLYICMLAMLTAHRLTPRIDPQVCAYLPRLADVESWGCLVVAGLSTQTTGDPEVSLHHCQIIWSRQIQLQ